MRVQVKYPGAQPHEIELLGRVSIIGRDPSCDLVVHDVKCSRRHAVLEAGPDGVTVRDSGSANGVFVNGQRVDRSVLRAGDTISLGEVQIVLLPEPGSASAEATLLTPSGGFAAAPPAPAGPPPRPLAPAPPPPAAPMPPASAVPAPSGGPVPPPPEPARPRGSYALSGRTESGRMTAEQMAGDLSAEAAAQAAAAERPLTVTVLAVLWMASVLLYFVTGVGGLVAAGGIAGLASVIMGGGLAVVSAVMALGLWKVKPWARIAQIVIAALGALTCTFTLPSVAILVYMLRAGVRTRFTTGAGPGDSSEGLFTGLILATVALGVLVAAGGWALMALGMTGSRIE